jgi:hypothetical protein
VMLLAAREVVPGAFENNMDTLTRIAELGHVLYLIDGERRRFMGPQAQVQACMAWARRQLPMLAPG